MAKRAAQCDSDWEDSEDEFSGENENKQKHFSKIEKVILLFVKSYHLIRTF